MRSPRSAATEAEADRRVLNSSCIVTDALADLQAYHIAWTFFVGYTTAATIARLAYRVAR